jgi:hypothetical protein
LELRVIWIGGGEETQDANNPIEAYFFGPLAPQSAILIWSASRENQRPVGCAELSAHNVSTEFTSGRLCRKSKLEFKRKISKANNIDCQRETVARVVVEAGQTSTTPNCQF